MTTPTSWSRAGGRNAEGRLACAATTGVRSSSGPGSPTRAERERRAHRVTCGGHSAVRPAAPSDLASLAVETCRPGRAGAHQCEHKIETLGVLPSSPSLRKATLAYVRGVRDGHNLIDWMTPDGKTSVLRAS